MNHTPTPFQVRFNGIVAPAILFHQTPQGEQRIAEIYQGGDEGEANAAFIVRACNAHDALVTELDRMCRVYSQRHAGDGSVDSVCKSAYITLELAK